MSDDGTIRVWTEVGEVASSGESLDLPGPVQPTGPATVFISTGVIDESGFVPDSGRKEAA